MECDRAVVFPLCPFWGGRQSSGKVPPELACAALCWPWWDMHAAGLCWRCWELGASGPWLNCLTCFQLTQEPRRSQVLPTDPHLAEPTYPLHMHLSR